MVVSLRDYRVTALMFGGHSFAQHAPTARFTERRCLVVDVNGLSGVLFIVA